MRLTSGDGVSVGAISRAEWAGGGGGGGVASTEGGKRLRAWAGIGPARGRERFLLFFLFSNFYFYFLYPFLLNN
jgi:hypothetical protein